MEKQELLRRARLFVEDLLGEMHEGKKSKKQVAIEIAIAARQDRTVFGAVGAEVWDQVLREDDDA